MSTDSAISNNDASLSNNTAESEKPDISTTNGTKLEGISVRTLFIAGLVFGSAVSAWFLWEKAYHTEKLSRQSQKTTVETVVPPVIQPSVKIDPVQKKTLIQPPVAQPSVEPLPQQPVYPTIPAVQMPLQVMQATDNVLSEQKKILEKLDHQTQKLQLIEDRLHRLELGFQTLPLIQSLERSLQKGIPFATTLDVLAGIRPELDIPLLNKYAQKGVPTESFLVQEGMALLTQAYHVNLQNVTAKTDYEWINFLIQQMAEWVDIRPNQVQLGDDLFAVLSQMEQALKEKDYDRLLDDGDRLNDVAKPIFKTWLEKIDEVQQVYREFEFLQKSFLQSESSENDEKPQAMPLQGLSESTDDTQQPDSDTPQEQEYNQ